MPLTPQARTGLIAIILVGGLFVAVLGLISIVYLWHVRPNGPTASIEPKPERLADRPVSTGDEKDDASYILGHRWWRKPPTRDRLEQLVQVVVGGRAGATVSGGVGCALGRRST